MYTVILYLGAFLYIPLIHTMQPRGDIYPNRESSNGPHLTVYERNPDTPPMMPAPKRNSLVRGQTIPGTVETDSSLHHSVTLPSLAEHSVDIPENDPMLASLAAIGQKYTNNQQLPAAPKRRKSICIITHEETPRNEVSSQPTLMPVQHEGLSVQPDKKTLGKRYSIALSEISDNSTDEATWTQQPKTPLCSESITTQLSVELSPQEKNEVEKAIEEIRQTDDPISKAEKQNLLLLNVTFKQFRSLNTSFDAIAKSIDEGNRQTLETMQATAQQTQKNLAQVQEGLQEMRRAQKKQRRLNYISFGVGICGLSLFLINFINQQMQNRDSQA